VPDDQQIRQVDGKEWDSYRGAVHGDKEYSAVTARWSPLHRLDPRYPSNLYILFVDGKAASFNATYFARGREKSAWGRYVNFHLAYTFPEYRRRGYTTLIARTVFEQAHAQGYKRVKSLCQTYGGYRLQVALGHEFWGFQSKYHDGRARLGTGALVVDSPLSKSDSFPEGVPYEAARSVNNPHKLSAEELQAVFPENR
jgi:GNAT superfamily N-acetyltransferase